MPTEPFSKALPVELWYHVLLQHPDQGHQWTTCRQVCSLWRSEISKIFAHNPLIEQTTIHFDCGEAQFHGMQFPLRMNMVFDRFDENDSKRCVFSEGPAVSVAEATLLPSQLWKAAEQQAERHKRVKWTVEARFYQGQGQGQNRPRGDYPLYQICIDGRALDTELPGLRFDLEENEISFEWEGMFNRFYYELDEIEGRAAAHSERSRDDVRRGMKAQVVDRYRREVRRERIRRIFGKNLSRSLSQDEVVKWEDLAVRRCFDVEERARSVATVVASGGDSSSEADHAISWVSSGEPESGP